jgi:hypothetical protein
VGWGGPSTWASQRTQQIMGSASPRCFVALIVVGVEVHLVGGCRCSSMQLAAAVSRWMWGQGLEGGHMPRGSARLSLHCGGLPNLVGERGRGARQQCSGDVTLCLSAVPNQVLPVPPVSWWWRCTWCGCVGDCLCC